MFFSNKTASKYMKQNLKELKEIMNKSAIIIVNFNISPSVTIRKKSQDIENINNTIK